VKARPDGYTLLLAGAVNTINATLYQRLNFVFVRDIAPIASMVSVPSNSEPCGGCHPVPRRRWS
jgi:hypothetical protein